MKIKLYGNEIDVSTYGMFKSFETDLISIKITSVLYRANANAWDVSFIETRLKISKVRTLRQVEFIDYIQKLMDVYLIEYIPLPNAINYNQIRKPFNMLRKLVRTHDQFKIRTNDQFKNMGYENDRV